MSSENTEHSDIKSAVCGLSDAQVRRRVEAGKVNVLPPRCGKTVADIVRSNVFTRINAMLGVLFVLVAVTGSWINSAFGVLIVLNSAIGIVQELRARSTLEKLSLVGEEHPQVMRGGKCVRIAQEELVVDDVICLRAGTEITVDGEVLEAEELAVDESMLTGESDAVPKRFGDRILSGSFVTVGTGKYRVTNVGADCHAAKITARAAKYSLHKSQLQAGIDTILKYIVWVLVPVAVLTVFTQYSNPDHTWRSLILAICGALVPMVPEGLVLITSTAFALGVIRLGKRKCLVNELPAIEGLARVDVVCADKTGTLTENRLRFACFAFPGDEVLIAQDGAVNKTPPEEGKIGEASLIAAQLAWNDKDPNLTVCAVRDALARPQQLWKPDKIRPFSSAEKWSGMDFAGNGYYILGAPDVLSADSRWLDTADRVGDLGLRVLLLARSALPVGDIVSRAGRVEGGPEPLALLVFEQTVREDVADTLDFFKKQGVAVKIISGDNARAVAAVSRRLGLETGDPVDARTLNADNFTQSVREGVIFGRVRPDQKQEMVKSLQSCGYNVAMTGDGVNDVLALKDADIGVAMGSGAAASRAVAKIVLLDNRFATLPYVVAEGRRVIANIERVANLFLTKTIYSAILAMLVILSAVPFPFLPIHVTITGWFTIGVPAFILSLPPNYRRARGGFTRRVLRFAFPAGVIVGVSAFTAYLLVSGGHVPQSHVRESTAALLALIVPSVWVLAVVARPWNRWKILLIFLPALGYALIFTMEFTQRIFVLDSSDPRMMLSGLAVGLAGACLVEILWRISREKDTQEPKVM